MSTGAEYLVIPRAAIGAMPADWQAALNALVDRLSEAFPNVLEPGAYDVGLLVEVPVRDLTESQRQALGVTVSVGCLDPAHLHCLDDRCTVGTLYHDAAGRELTPTTHVRVPVGDPAALLATVEPRSYAPTVGRPAIDRRLHEATAIATYLNALFAAARQSAATTRVDPALALAISDFASTFRALPQACQGLADAADSL